MIHTFFKLKNLPNTSSSEEALQEMVKLSDALWKMIFTQNTTSSSLNNSAVNFVIRLATNNNQLSQITSGIKFQLNTFFTKKKST